MTIIQAIILGMIQGLTEFLPVSSSGHLVILPRIFGWEAQSLVFDTTLHLGTVLALIVYFWKDLREVVTKNKALGVKILIGSVPAGILGFLFEDAFENYFRSVSSVVLFLILGSILMFAAEKFFKSRSNKISYENSFIIGLFQSLALFPGMSRSGATISGGMLLGLSREKAAKFSFLLAIPLIGGAGVYKLISSFGEVAFLDVNMLVGFLVSFLFGILAIKLLLKFLRLNKLYVFIVYRLLLVGFLFIIASS